MYCQPLPAQTTSPTSVRSTTTVRSSLSDAASEKKVEALLQKMTLEEKVGQLVQYSAGQPTGPGTGRSNYDDMIRKGEVGALFNITTAHNINAYQRIAVEQSRLHVPLIFGLDVIHGFRTEFPIPLGLASSWDPELIERTARVAAREASASGIRWTFSPMVDIARDARWGRITEGSGEDPYLGAAMARAYVRGYQGPRLDAVDSDGSTAARKAFLAGVDMDMVSSLYHENLAQLVRSGEVPETAVDEAVRRVLRVKFALGLFEHPYADETREAGAMLQPESLSLARTAADRSLVLLKNASFSGGAPVLPLSNEARTIALIGPLADDPYNMPGSSSAQGQSEDVITLRMALIQRVGADRVRYAKGTDILGGSEEQFAEALKTAEQSDVVILALGENAPEMTGEAASRAYLGLPGRQQQLLEKIVATGKPVVLLVFSGRPLTLPWAFERVPVVLAPCFPGGQAGPALVPTIFCE